MPLTTEERLAALEAKLDTVLAVLAEFKATAEPLLNRVRHPTGALARMKAKR
jgi:hypothetical protein